jgi:hypothetical protein
MPLNNSRDLKQPSRSRVWRGASFEAAVIRLLGLVALLEKL